MGILNSKYDVNIHFSDLVDIESHSWNDSFFDQSKLSPIQIESRMVDGTFEQSWPELLAANYEETHTRADNMGTILFNAISPFLKRARGRNIYMPSMVKSGWYKGNIAYSFTIWDEIQREYVFTMNFSFRDE